MTFCATLFEGVAVWAGLPATLFALMLLLGFRLNTRFTWILLLLGVAGLATEGLSIACAGWSTGTAIVPTISVGICVGSGETSIDDLIARADASLLERKRQLYDSPHGGA